LWAGSLVDDVTDCIVTLLATGLDHLVIGDRIVRRAEAAQDAVLRLRPRLPALVELVEVHSGGGDDPAGVRHVVRRRDFPSRRAT
jgi:hypothetical protein